MKAVHPPLLSRLRGLGGNMEKKALIVDNDFFFVEFLGEILEERGYTVLKAYDGKEGISKLGEGDFAVIFVDLVMPKIDGLQLIRYIRKKFPEASFPIVVVAGTVIERLPELKKLGADFYIAKGALEKMSAQIIEFMEQLEQEGLAAPVEEEVLQPGELYPRQATIELMDNIEFHRSVVNDLAIGVVVVDKDARIILANPAALRILKRPFEGILNEHLMKIFPASTKDELVAGLKRVIKEKELQRVVLFPTIGSERLRIQISRFVLRNRSAGWILAFEHADQWNEGS